MRTTLSCMLILPLLLACATTGQETEQGRSTTDARVPPGIDTVQAFTKAIADHIKAMRERDVPFTDTVYINKHDQFPQIDLPALIGATTIRVLTSAEATMVKDGERFVCLNIIGWFTNSTAEFQVITFERGFRHRPDGRDDRHLYYKLDERNVLVPDSLPR